MVVSTCTRFVTQVPLTVIFRCIDAPAGIATNHLHKGHPCDVKHVLSSSLGIIHIDLGFKEPEKLEKWSPAQRSRP